MSDNDQPQTEINSRLADLIESLHSRLDALEASQQPTPEKPTLPGVSEGESVAQAIYDRKRGNNGLAFSTDGHKRTGGGIFKPDK